MNVPGTQLRLIRTLLFAMMCVTAATAAFAADTPHAVPGDRWMEIDLYWFQQDHIQASADEFWKRFAPLYQGVQGDKGVILNVGWTVEYIMDWSGDLNQRILLPTRNDLQLWVNETGPLRGNWEQMHEEWKTRFAQPVSAGQKVYEPWTYGDLNRLAIALRETGAKHGIQGFKVGSLVYGRMRAAGTHGEIASWAKRHPEAFDPMELGKQGDTFYAGPVFNPRSRLHTDMSHLGGLPNGIAEGMPAYQAFAAQWGSLSKAVGLDAIMLRDEFGMAIPYQRSGPFGPLAPSSEAAHNWNTVVAALVRETKLANPKALVMMYSNGVSAISDWRSNCFDLESIAKQGYLDVFVDQTWAGAWNEAGVRYNSFWNNPVLGWTYQLAYMLMHSVVLSDTKVRHYSLVETFDAWESWDVIHTVPQRLRWGIWAYSHATVKTPEGLKLPGGSYISWANQGKRLLSDDDVHLLATNINAAVRDAHHTTKVYGPTLVYSRETMQWQMDHASPTNDIKEWIDEQAGSIIKWPLPILSATRVEWLPEVHSDLFILQTPVHLSPQHTKTILHLIASGHPVAAFGSPVGGMDPRIAKALGLTGLSAVDSSETQHAATASSKADVFAQNIPGTFPTKTRLTMNQATSQAETLYSVEGSPALIIHTSHGKKAVAWDPPTFTYAGGKPLVETWGGSAAPYVLTAGTLNALISTPGFLHAAQIDLNQTMNVSAWRTADGQLHLMAAQLEEGLRNDADRSRHASLVLPSCWNISTFQDVWSGKKYGVHDHQVTVNLRHAESVLLTSSH